MTATAAPPRFRLTASEPVLGVVVIAIAGELDLATAPDLAIAARAAAERVDHLVIDLRSCSFIDSSGLRAIDSACDAMSMPTERRIGIVAGARLQGTFRAAGVHHSLPIHHSLTDALEHPRRGSASAGSERPG